MSFFRRWVPCLIMDRTVAFLIPMILATSSGVVSSRNRRQMASCSRSESWAKAR